MSMVTQIQPGAPTTPIAESAKTSPYAGVRVFVRIGDKFEDVIELDRQGAVLIFESDKGKFLELAEAQIRELSHENRKSYTVSQALNQKHNPAMDGFSAKLTVGETRNRRSEIEAMIKGTAPTASAMKKLMAYVGGGFKHRWARPDKLEHWKELGYDFVKPDEKGLPADPDALVNVRANGAVFSTRVSGTVDELILMRAPIEEVRKQRESLNEMARRQVQGASKREGLRDMPSRPDLFGSDD
jgi:hypothetical protein